MKKAQLLDISTYIGSLKLSELTNDNTRHAMRDFYRALRKIANPIFEDIEDTKREIFGEKQGEVNRWAELDEMGTPEAKKEMEGMPEIKRLVDDFRLSYAKIANEDVQDAIPKIEYDVLIDALSDRDVSLEDIDRAFGDFLKY